MTGRAEAHLEAIHQLRLAGISEGTWPVHTLDEWRRIARDAEDLDDRSRTPMHRRALEIVATLDAVEAAAS